jgi:hypothetical protein
VPDGELEFRRPDGRVVPEVGERLDVGYAIDVLHPLAG